MSCCSRCRASVFTAHWRSSWRTARSCLSAKLRTSNLTIETIEETMTTPANANAVQAPAPITQLPRRNCLEFLTKKAHGSAALVSDFVPQLRAELKEHPGCQDVAAGITDG